MGQKTVQEVFLLHQPFFSKKQKGQVVSVKILSILAFQ